MAMRSRWRIVHCAAGSALLALLLSASAQAGGDRVFANGFEDCCRIGGTVSGLSGAGLVLRLASGPIVEDKAITGNGSYSFATILAPGSSYLVSIENPPAGAPCVLSNASGTVEGDVGNVDVACGSGQGLVWDQGRWGDDWQ